MTPRVTLIITQRESYVRSRESLENVLRHTPCPFDLIYVDGGSPPHVRDELLAMAAEHGFQLLREERFLAPNEAKCLAIPCVSLGTEHVVFLDNDVLVQPGWLEALLRCAMETSAAAVAPLYLERLGAVDKLHMLGGLCRIVESHGRRTLVETHEHRKGRVPGQPLPRQQTEHVEMHALLVRMEVVKALAPFDPAIPSMPENADFCLTLQQAGGEIWMEPQARVTVLLPEAVEETDAEFFKTRWGDAWLQRGFQHFAQKWRLAGPQPVLASQRRWAVAHRMVAHPASFHRLLGIKSDSVLNRRLLAPLERWWLRH